MSRWRSLHASRLCAFVLDLDRFQAHVVLSAELRSELLHDIFACYEIYNRSHSHRCYHGSYITVCDLSTK
jgi:hypothetical protein